MTEKSDGV